MTDASTIAETSAAELIGSRFSGEHVAPSTTPVVESTTTEPTGSVMDGDTSSFDFDAEFQTRVATLALRSIDFVSRVGHLLKPQYFEDLGEASLVNLALKYHERNRALPDKVVMADIVKKAVGAKIIKQDVVPLVTAAYKKIFGSAEVTGREYVEERIVEFARHQATAQAILKSVELLERGEFDKVEKYIKEAVEVGANEDGGAYDYYSTISLRTAERLDDASGVKPPRGITTGHLKLDEILYHRGWGRKELATIMGGAKSGKTTALIGFAKGASLAKFNVLYVTLEVSARIISERLDAAMSDTMVKELGKHIKDVESKIAALEARAGKLVIHEYPSGTFTPNQLRALLDRYEAKGVNFDLVVVDYADIMAPNFRYNDVIENSKSIYVDLRAIAQEKNVAMLTATQTNREGYKATVAKAEHVAEDFNKVRTVDLMISINITDEERSRGEARLYFAASRNQESGFTLFIKQDIAKMKFIESVVRKE
jgi:replicative DNA helicase